MGGQGNGLVPIRGNLCSFRRRSLPQNAWDRLGLNVPEPNLDRSGYRDF